MKNGIVARDRLWLDFDGGAWLGRVPLSRSSPWAELLAAAGVGLILGITMLPTRAGVSALGWATAGVLSPVLAAAGTAPLLTEGSWRWPLSPGWISALGWATASMVTADAVQAAVPLSFSWRLLAATVFGPALALGIVAALSAVPWDRLLAQIERLA